MTEELKEVPVLQDGQVYIYVLLNAPDNNIKIGKTTNLPQRIQALSGSNGGGNKIIEWYYSPPTYLDSLEKVMHNHFHFARIPDTEWFLGSKVSFYEVVSYLESLFLNEEYSLCNQLRLDFKKRQNFQIVKQEYF